MTFFRRTLTFALASGAVGVLGAQAPTRPPVRDSAPPLRAPAVPSGPRPADVAPRTRQAPRAVEAQRQPVDSASRAPKPMSPPVESVKPKPATVQAPTPLVSSPPPALPAAKPASVVAPVSVRADDAPPPNATGRCKDGSWLYGTITDESCASHGGGEPIRLPVKLAPPTPPRRP